MKKFEENFLSEIKNHTHELAEHFLRHSPDGKFICPFCGNGSGENGTGVEMSQHGNHCFVCDTSFTIFQAIQAEHKCSFQEAVKNCADFLSIPTDTANNVNFDSALNFQKALSYLKSRALDDKNLIEKFSIAYDAKTDCIVIPHENDFCTRRYIGTNTTKPRFNYLKGVKIALFNSKALVDDAVVFVTEGAIDALSIIKAGGQAVAIGGVSNTKLLLNELKARDVKPILVILMDNDEAGNKAAKKLLKGLEKLQIRAFKSNIPTFNGNDKTDANDLLIHDPKALTDYIAEVANIAFHTEKVESNNILPYKTDINEEIEQLKVELETVKKSAPSTLTEELVALFLNSAFTDMETADLFVDVYKDTVKFNHNTDDWFLWEGNHWQEVPTKNNRLLYESWKIIVQWVRIQAKINFEIAKKDFCENNHKWSKDTVEIAKENLARLKKNINKAENLESKSKTSNTLEMASGSSLVSTYDKDYDADKYAFNLANKTINLKDMSIIDPRPADLITLVANTYYDPNSYCKEWEDFIVSAIPDLETRVYVQKFCGYCLLGSADEDVFFFLYGQGGSGKTTFIEAIKEPMGDYAKDFPIELLTENFKQSNGEEPNPQLYKMRHARLIYANETKKNRKFDTMKLKEWTGGGNVTARDLFKTPVSFTPQFKIIITGNFAPSIEDITDEGLRRRLRIIPFDNKPKIVNTRLSEIFKTPKGMAAIFNWQLHGFEMYMEDKVEGINPFDMEHSPDEVKEALQRYYDANDNIAPFFEDPEIEIYFDPEQKTPVKDVWVKYLDWCKINGEKNLKRSDFAEMILRRYKNKNLILSKRSENGTRDMFKGIGIEKPSERNYDYAINED